MSIRRLLDVSLAALVFLGTVLLGMSQESPFLPAVMLIAVVASIWLTDIAGRLRLSPKWANVAAFAAVGFSVWRLLQSEEAIEPVAMIDVLVYVQVILLFQKKDLRARWDLAVLSLLEVAVAAASDQGVLFGALLVVYVCVGFTTLALLYLHRERACYEQSEEAAPVAGPASGARGRRGVDLARLGKIALAAFVVGPVALFLRYRQSPRSGQNEDRSPESTTSATSRSQGTRWPLVGRKAALSASRPSSLWPRATARHGVNRDFCRRLARLTLVTFALAPVVFLLLPRFGRLPIRFPRLRYVVQRQTEEIPGRIVGFSDSVALGELGRLTESDEEVLRIQFADHATNEPYPVSGNVYLRGTVLTRYKDGEWECEGWGPRKELQIPRRVELPPDYGLIRQTVRIRPMDRNELFCVWPFVVISGDSRLQYDAHCERLYRIPNSRGQQFIFWLGTTAFANGKQAELAPTRRAIDPQFFLQTPADAVPGLVALANEWIEESRIPADDPHSRALLLQERLRSSGQFQHSLEDRERDATLDPIEDFVVNNPSGNCEYFATALTLMLRSQGIPARVVVGYKCDEYDYQGRFYQVRQLHAHSWVEAYLAPEQLPDRLPEDRLLDWSRGGWLRLDPTPTVSGGLVAVNRLMAGVESWIEWLNFAWANYVIGMNGSRQREQIYGRLVALLRQTGQRMVSVDWWTELFRKAGRSLSRSAGQWTDDTWALVWSVPIALAIALLLIFAYARLRAGRRRLPFHFLAGRGSKEKGNEASVGFYRRLEALLARHGLARAPTQTQREFARQAGAALAEATGQRSLARLPVQVAEAFYCVRFGGLSLDHSRTETVKQALHRLEQVTNGRPPTAP